MILKLYAVKDRLINYYQQPFIGPGDKAVQSSLATLINDPEETNAIAQAPHHFELWELAEISEDGEVKSSKQLVCDCASLIRPGLRERALAGTPTGSKTPPGRTGTPSSGVQHTDTQDRPPENAAPATSQ